jgi:hypothetical protein
VKVIGTLAHSGRAAGLSLMMVCTDLKYLFLCFLVSNSMADPPEIGIMVPKDGKAFKFWVLNLILVLTNFRVVVVRFPELAVVVESIGLPATEGKIAEMVAMMIVVVETAAL